MLKVTRWSSDQPFPDRLIRRLDSGEGEVREVVRAILDDVRDRGDAAVLDYTRRFDSDTVSCLRVTEKEIADACAKVDVELMAVIRRAADNIRAYHMKQKRETWLDITPERTLGQLIRPIESVGVYVPGGTAAYPSSVLMNVIPAQVAGVERIVMTTPCMKDGSVYPPTLATAHLLGVTEIYKAGGAQAVGMLAYGTNTVKAVAKITGPGNIYVATAKREVAGLVGIDMIAGPSEILIIADETARADWVAADMLSQAEHDPLACAILVTDCESLAQSVPAELEKQLATLPRDMIAEQSLRDNGLIVLTNRLIDAVEAANVCAPEHLELAVADPWTLLPLIRSAGAVFMGHCTPEPAGDYFAGPNHVLPTSGTAAFSSPLSVDDFIKKTSLIQYSQVLIERQADDIAAFARSEGLEAHARAAEIRRVNP